jgi:phosphoglycolate phosphatase-like HAD superfamily hydrolase
MFVVFDLDGTLALNDHRKHFVERPEGEKDWRGFFAACDKDRLCWQVARVLQALHAGGCRVEIWSGRSSEVIDKTRRWLAEHGLDRIPFRGRDEGDHTPDHELKKSWLDASDPKPDLVFDDRASVVKMWRDAGVVCAQVAEGAF